MPTAKNHTLNHKKKTRFTSSNPKNSPFLCTVLYLFLEVCSGQVAVPHAMVAQYSYTVAVIFSQYDTCCEFRIYYITQGIGSCFYFRVSRIQAFIIRDHFTEEALRGRVPFRQIFCVILAAGYTALALMLID